MSGRPSFWKELRERRVVRVALVYLAVGWAVVEGSGTLGEILQLPASTQRLVFALVVLGFPVAMVLTWALQVTPEGVRRAEPYAPDSASRMPFLGGLAVGVATVSGLAFLFFGEGEAPADVALDADAVAVIPFRVSAPDGLSYLGGGVMELLAARLDGEVGPRSIDPGLVSSVSQRDSTGAVSVARSVGAGLVLTGSAVGDASGLVYSAELARVSDGDIVARASTEAHPDSLTAAADQLIGQLLSLSAGEYPESVALLTSTSPEALRAYLLGKEAWRASRYFDAVDHYDRALDLDSTFALAAIARADGGNMAAVSRRS